jgi:hypothetical protein
VGYSWLSPESLMKRYSTKDFTFGYEIEFGDVDRRLEIPSHLGQWEFAETDIVNLRGPFKYLATDPLGTNPYMGGEINTVPSRTWQAQVKRILKIIEFFRKKGNQPTTSCVNHGHLHIRVPNLTKDISGLKRLVAYIQRNQQDVVDTCYQFRYTDEMKQCENATSYLKFDGGRLMPDFMCQNIISKAKNFDDFIRLQAAGIDHRSVGRPFRYAINTYCLKHTDTIEFRCFRATIKEIELESQFRFAEAFMDAALNDGPPAKDIFKSQKFFFPAFVWNRDEYLGWNASKYSKARGRKERRFQQAT